MEEVVRFADETDSSGKRRRSWKSIKHRFQVKIILVVFVNIYLNKVQNVKKFKTLMQLFTTNL